MDEEQLKRDYIKYEEEYKKFQNEVFLFVDKYKEEYGSKYGIHVYEIKQRKDSIKSIDSIILNFKDPRKYIGYRNIFDIKDIAGVRITCHCEDDVENITNFLSGKIKQRYDNIDVDRKGENEKDTEENNKDKEKGRKSNPLYRANHITFNQTNGYKLPCEIQIRTVMADARAVQDRKYIYGRGSEGEQKELTNAASKIMAGCEHLWSLVKRKSIETEKGGENNNEKIEYNQQELGREITISTEDDNKPVDRFESNKEKASEGLGKLNIKTYMEIEVYVPYSLLNIDIGDLKEHAKNSIIETFGWPIGVSIDNRPELSPKPSDSGIFTEVSLKRESISGNEEGASYDYWAINKNGAFYLKKSLFEDNRNPKQIFFNTRIIRITEVFMYIKNLYSYFGIEKDIRFKVTIKHGGLAGRILGSSSPNRSLFGERKIEINAVSTTITTTINEIETDMVDIVETFTKSLFEKFEFFKLSKDVLKDIVTHYLNGEVV